MGRIWILCIAILVELLVAVIACPSNSDTCAIINSTKFSLATQVINTLKKMNQSNDSVTFYISPGMYNTTDGTHSNFFNFSNIIFQKDPKQFGEVIIQCPFTDVGDFNGLGFNDCTDISIIGLTLTNCGPKATGFFFRNVNNLYIINSTFHHNLNNGVAIHSGTKVAIINCTFENNIGLQDDYTELLVTQVSDMLGGAGLGIALQYTINTSVIVENCTFKNNVALKRFSLGENESDTRPYNYIPYGNGGGIYINLISVTDVKIRINNCHFYDNTALHQGGGITTYITSSYGTLVEVVDCDFIGNKAIGSIPLFSINKQSIANFKIIEEINKNYSVRNFSASIGSVLLHDVVQTGGIGGGIAVNIFRDCEYNNVVIKRSNFKKNAAIGSGGIRVGTFVPLSNTSNGKNTNRAWITGSNFYDNHALVGGSAIGFISNTHIDIANLPTVIDNCQFKGNVNEGNSQSPLFRFGTNGAITTIRSPLTFLGENQFDSNIGGCININSAKVDMNGTMNFTNNTGTPLGGAIRIVGFSLVQLFPSTNMIFERNRAQRLGGAIGVDNVRVEEDLALILNYNCFLQYNIGNDDEFYPSNWKAYISFSNNTADQGFTMYAEDISRCTSTPYHHVRPNSTVFENSFFSFLGVFKDPFNYVTSEFVSAPSYLLVNNENVTFNVFPGEEFILSLRVLDQNNNLKDGFFTYPSNTFFTEADITEIDLTAGNEDTSFGIVNGSSDLRVSLVVRNSQSNFSFSANHNNTIVNETFNFTLIDSSTGIGISEITIGAKLRSCHFLYMYNSSRGICEFFTRNNTQILRGDNISTYFYIQSELYGELENGSLRTARIPPFYQKCEQEGGSGGLPGCLVKYDSPHQQCSQNKKGFLCGICPSSSGNEVKGLAFDLLECVSCETSDRILFVLILWTANAKEIVKQAMMVSISSRDKACNDCFSSTFARSGIFIVILSTLIMYYNIGLPNSLRGFLFYSQLIGYVYVGGARGGMLHWDLILSRVFGFSFYFPICLASMNALQVASFGFLPPVLILMSVISYTILARRITPLSNRKTLDGIWFLILIIYVYTFDTCFNLLRCTASSVHTNDFTEIEFHSLVYFYDGSITCFQDEHIIYAAISILVLVTFVIPFPFIVVAISHNYFKKSGPFRDVINTGIKSKFKWWSGYDLLRRLLFVTIHSIFESISSGDYTQFALTLCGVFILLITSRIHPYDKWAVNLIECIILLDLILISAYFVDTNRSVTGTSFGTFLFILPYIYMLIYLMIKCIRRTKFFKNYKRRVYVLKLSSLSEILLNEIDDTEKMEDSPYTEYREELLEYS